MKIKSLIISTILMATSCNLTAKDIQLPEPARKGGMPLMEAINNRHSTREFSEATLTEQQLSDMLWAACGYNRPDKRTVATALNRQEMSAYIVTPEAIYKYEPKENKLIFINDGDHRNVFAMQDFAKKAPLNVALVADMAKQDKEVFAGMTVGAMSNNIYLWCASEGLNTVVRASFDQEGMKKALKLNENEQVLLVQTVGK
ncbi:MAG: SagB/ThcOx family dehydrogenase [Muribaculaceae bacterium]|nr:SagB/ThcOx family dehydrogenase [Muribaculaceae bacterium]